VVSACAPANAATVNPTVPPTIPLQNNITPSPFEGRAGVGSATPLPSVTPSLTVPPTLTFTPTITLTPSITPTPTPDLRLAPERWKEWPVIPAITNRAIQIYKEGIKLGNDPRHFGKVGDCQCVNAAFMGFYDHPERFTFSKENAYLKETVDYFAGSFDRVSAAVKGGFNVASVLTPLQSDPAICSAGETPLQCEFRLHKPSIVFISMETGFTGRTAATYEKYMRQIIEFVIAKGALPILATKADNVEGDHSINLATAKLAYEYDLPLWNFWRAVQSLPNRGMDATRPDGFHISVEGWNVRSFTALQVLDAAWKAVR